MTKQHYKTLHLTEDATQEQIKAAYRAFSKANHPDKGGDPDMMSKINEAYSVLGDPEKRDFYDQYGSVQQKPMSIEEAAKEELETVFKMLLGERFDKGSLFILAHNGMARALESSERNKHQVEERIRQAKERLEFIKSLRDKVKPGMELLGKVIQSEITDIENAISAEDIHRFDYEIAVHKKVIEILEKDYPKEEQQESIEQRLLRKKFQDRADSFLYTIRPTASWR